MGSIRRSTEAWQVQGSQNTVDIHMEKEYEKPDPDLQKSVVTHNKRVSLALSPQTI